jgi:hypothetical protein
VGPTGLGLIAIPKRNVIRHLSNSWKKNWFYPRFRFYRLPKLANILLPHFVSFKTRKTYSKIVPKPQIRISTPNPFVYSPFYLDSSRKQYQT